MPQPRILDFGEQQYKKRKGIGGFMDEVQDAYKGHQERSAIDEILGEYKQNMGEAQAYEKAQLNLMQDNRIGPTKRLEIQSQLDQVQKTVIEKDKALNARFKAAQADKIYNDIKQKYEPKQQSNAPEGQTAQQAPVEQPNESNVEQSQGTGGIQDFSDEDLITLTGVPGYAEEAKQTLKSRQEDRKEVNADKREMRKETLPLRTEIAKRADAARKGIQNKTQLQEIIDRGNLNDPTFAVLADLLPFDLGKRLLSDDSVVYKAGLVDEFTDLRNIFQGQTRVKEIEILQEKLADLYLTDDQKKAILKSRINALQADVIKEEAAEEVERKHPNLGVLQFNRAVDEIAKPKMDKLFNQILEEQKSVINVAEKKKQIPLTNDDPESSKIIKDILKQAGGNKDKARELARKQGYKF